MSIPANSVTQTSPTPQDTSISVLKVLIPNELTGNLPFLAQKSLEVATKMLRDRSKTSSKYWKEVPCVIAKSLSRKYQRNLKCKKIRNIVMPICGEKGMQIKLVDGGIRIPSLFKKNVLPVHWPKPIVGHVRGVEIACVNGKWFATFSYNTIAESKFMPNGCVGVDRNSVGNIAVMADNQTGKVLHLGFNPAFTKKCWRNRKRNLQRAGKRRLLARLRRKQRRRTTYENHVVSRSIVDYASKHRRAIAIENLNGVRKKKSSIKVFSDRSQWSFYQLGQFIRYKAALRGVSVFVVNPAYTSQDCSRCGSRHKTKDKNFYCLSCGHKDHRDANSAFNIARRGMQAIDELATNSERCRSGLLVVPFLGSEETK